MTRRRNPNLAGLFYGGRRYVRVTGSKYFKNCEWDGEKYVWRYMHREVWKAENGPIPDGHHIHHRDHDPGNNDPANLECMSHSEHNRIHGLEQFKTTFANREHRQMALKRAQARYQNPTTRVCEVCGGKFQGFTARWCSARCADRAREGYDQKKKCRECGEGFWGRPKSLVCESCSKRLKLRVCEQCSETFAVAKPSSNRRFCSQHCSGVFNRRRVLSAWNGPTR
jgi:hypothetical protein